MSAPTIEQLIAFAKQAGDHAYAMQRDVVLGVRGSYTKTDSSLVTDADLAVTELFHNAFASYLTDDSHLVVDEETHAAKPMPAQQRQQRLEQAEYLWGLDPVDGTVAFAAGSPLWGVSLGIMKHGRPWLGVIYVPALRELFYTDGEKAFMVSENLSFEPMALSVRGLDAVAEKPILHPMMTGTPKMSTKDAGFYAIAPWASVFKHAWLVSNRQHGVIFSGTTLWDSAAGFALLAAAGGGAFLLNSPANLLKSDMRGLFNANWQLPHRFITCRPEDRDAVQGYFAKAYDI